MANIIASGVVDANSADQVVATGATLTLSLIYTQPANPQSSAVASIQIKGSDGGYYPWGWLTVHNSPRVLDGAGTYRVSRVAAQNMNGAAFGVDAT